MLERRKPETAVVPVHDEPEDDKSRAFSAPVYARSLGRDHYLLFRSKLISRNRILLSCKQASLVPFLPGVTLLELTVMLHHADSTPLHPEHVTLLAKYSRFLESTGFDVPGISPGLELTIVQSSFDDGKRWNEFVAQC